MADARNHALDGKQESYVSRLRSSLRERLDRSSIRLIDIEPASDFHQPVVCTARTVLLGSPGPYIALSYTWGDAGLTDDVQCDDVVIPVTPNLVQGLKRLRQAVNWLREKGFRKAAVWADQICINQDDVAERNQQVALMAKIFANSTLLVIWLGDLDAQNLQDLQKCNWASMLDPDKEDYGGVHGSDNEEPVRDWKNSPMQMPFEPFILPEHRSSFSVTLARVCHYRPWFTRRWVIQESRLQKKSYIFLQNIVLATEFYTDYGCSAYIGETPPFYPMTPRDPAALLQNLNEFEGMECSDARDLVFALLGVSNDCQDIIPDYSQTVEDIFLSVALKYVNQHSVLALLACASFQPPEEKDRSNIDSSLPSWVPDWRQEQRFCKTALVSVQLMKCLDSIDELDLQYLGSFLRLDGRMLSIEGWLVVVEEGEFPEERPGTFCIIETRRNGTVGFRLRETEGSKRQNELVGDPLYSLDMMTVPKYVVNDLEAVKTSAKTTIRLV